MVEETGHFWKNKHAPTQWLLLVQHQFAKHGTMVLSH
jgi:hypothetical protein